MIWFIGLFVKGPHPNNPIIGGSFAISKWEFFGRKRIAKIYDANNETQITYGTVIHEWAHAAHWRLGSTKEYLEASGKVQESWARGVAWSLTTIVYPDDVSYHFKPDYTGVVKDMIDFGTSQHPCTPPHAKDYDHLEKEKENVSAYKIRQMEQALKGKHELGHLGETI